MFSIVEMTTLLIPYILSNGTFICWGENTIQSSQALFEKNKMKNGNQPITGNQSVQRPKKVAILFY